MSQNTTSQDSFRRQLRSESEQWWREGLIDAALYERLAERYEFEGIEAASGSRFIAVLLGLGGILLGLGAITLVAANWQTWSRLLRMVVIFSAFIAVNGAGFYCWRRAGWQRLGVGLLLAGALVMGANIGLMSQMFHQGGSVSRLYLVWGLGVLVMAYSLRLTPLGVLSWVLLGLSYREVLMGGWFWRSGAIASDWITLLQLYLPLLLTPLYLPLAHWCRSRVLYGLWGISLLALLSAKGALVHWNGVVLATVLMLILALLWMYQAGLWSWPVNPSAQQKAEKSPLNKRLGANAMPVDLFQPIGRSLAIWILSFVLYGYSFHWVWTENGRWQNGSGSMTRSFTLGLIGLGAIALYATWQWLKQGELQLVPPSLWMKTPAFLVVLVLTGFGVFLQFQSTVEYGGVYLINVLLAFVGFAMLHDGVLVGVRHRFWGGMGIVVISLMSRIFEYDTGLTLKALVLAICGVAVIFAGLWFEQQTRSSTRQKTTKIVEKTS
ncbi:MAG: DUF2157 domain-containing protein [Phormidesmis sp.]